MSKGGVYLIIILALSACLETQVLQTDTKLPDEERYAIQVKGGVLLDSSSAATQEETPAVTPPKQEEEKPQQEANPEGDVLEMQPGDKDIQGTLVQGEENTVSPFDPEAIYNNAIKNLIPTDQVIRIERSEKLTVPELLEALAAKGKFNIAIADGLDSMVISKVNFPNIPLRDAFVAILKRYRLNLTRIGDVLWIDNANVAGDDLVFRVVRLSSISAQSLAPQLQEILGSIASSASGPADASGSQSGTQQANGYFTIHPDSNTIFLRAKPEIMQAMVQFLTAVDFRGPQVMIEMKVIEVSLEDLDRQGGAVSFADFFTLNKSNRGDFLSDFLFTADPVPTLDSSHDIAVGPEGNAADFIFRLIGGTSNRAQLFLDFLVTYAKADILSSPRIAVVSGQSASIELTDKLPYIQQTTTTGTGGTTTSDNVVFEEVGITLHVTPVIQQDRHVRLTLKPQISESPGRFPDDNGVPIVNERSITTELVVADGETFAIGGLIKDKTIISRSKVPLLGDIPGIKWLFSKESERHEKLEIIILITPRILVDKSDVQSISQKQIDTFRKFRETGERSNWND